MVKYILRYFWFESKLILDSNSLKYILHLNPLMIKMLINIRISFLVSILFSLFLNQLIKCQIDVEVEVKPHEKYKDLKCNHYPITSMTKIRDNKYFISTKGHKFWLIDDSEEPTLNNSRELSTITTKWNKIDSSLYFGVSVECDHRLKDKLMMVNYNTNTKSNEIIYGSIADWNWHSIQWYDFQAFQLVSDHFNWDKSIDGIAFIEETIIIFQGISYSINYFY